MPDTTTADLEAAAKEAEDAQARFLSLEYAALHNAPEKRPSAAEVVAQRTEADHAARRVEVTRRRLEEAREAARLASLDAVGADVTAYAATDPGAGIRAALESAHQAVEAYRSMVQAHDNAVADLCTRATAFADATGRTNPVLRGNSASAVSFGDIDVSKIGDHARLALDAALAGDLPKGKGHITPVRDRAPRTPSAWYADTVGQFPPAPVFDGRVDRSLAEMIRDGRARLMTPEEVSTWQASRQ